MVQTLIIRKTVLDIGSLQNKNLDLACKFDLRSK